MRLEGKVAIVTGGASGIGAGVVRRFVSDRVKVVIADIHDENANQLVEEMTNIGGEVIYVKTDVSNRDAVKNLLDKTISALGQVDILVNNAAYVHQSDAITNFLEYTDSAWEKTLAVNLYGLFYCSQEVARHMAKQGQGGSIINISSGGASRAHRHMFGYDTTKGGIEAATRGMALDLAGVNIRVNAVIPGNTKVDNGTVVGGTPIPPQDVIPLSRSGTPEDIAGAVAFLASDDALYITGSRIFVDGGMDAQLRTPSVDFKYDFSSSH
jgi:NAD(P)-dependent dehydrogenase (short-subunit alcohol dehydrogenase family)